MGLSVRAFGLSSWSILVPQALMGVGAVIALPILYGVMGFVIGAIGAALYNFFAGMVLLLARPYTAGEYVRVMAGSINGPLEGTITSIALRYTQLETPDGMLNIPNSVLLAAAVGPAEPGVTTKDDTPVPDPGAGGPDQEVQT